MMKRIALVLLLPALAFTTAEAQIVSSRSSQVITQPKIYHSLNPTTYVGVTVGLNSVSNNLHYEMGSILGFSLAIGHQFPLGHSRFAYAPEVGIASRGYTMDDKSYGGHLEWDYLVYGIYAAPVQFVWKPYFKGKPVSWEFGLGLYVGYDMFGKDVDYGGYRGKESFEAYHQCLDYGLNIDAGYWFNKHLYAGLRARFSMNDFFQSEGNTDWSKPHGKEISGSSSTFGVHVRYAF